MISGRYSNPVTILPATRGFLQYLQDWYYWELSSVSHLTLPGLVTVARPLRLSSRRDSRDEGYREMSVLRGYYFLATVVLTAAVFAEVEVALHLGGSADINRVWDILNCSYPYAREIYDQRGYRKLKAA
jgi:hypothetical protein